MARTRDGPTKALWELGGSMTRNDCKMTRGGAMQVV